MLVLGGTSIAFACRVEVLREDTSTVVEKDLKEYFETSYGTFRGEATKATKAAKLICTPVRPLWTTGEAWQKTHPANRDHLRWN